MYFLYYFEKIQFYAVILRPVYVICYNSIKTKFCIIKLPCIQSCVGLCVCGCVGVGVGVCVCVWVCVVCVDVSCVGVCVRV